MKGLKEQQEKRIIYLAVLLFAVVVIALFVLSQTFFGEENTESVFVSQQRSLIKNINIDFNVLKNDFLGEVQEFERIPYPEIKIGRENPFTSY